MKKLFTFPVLLAGLLFLIAGCEINNDEDSEILIRKIKESNYYYDPGMNCDFPASVQPPYQCLTYRDGNVWIGDYSGAYNLQGSWTNNSTLCLTLLTDGTGIYKTKATTGTIKSYTIKWGVLVDQNGVPQDYDGDSFVFLFIESTEIDPSLAYIQYNLSTGQMNSLGLLKGNCNF